MPKERMQIPEFDPREIEQIERIARAIEAKDTNTDHASAMEIARISLRSRKHQGKVLEGPHASEEMELLDDRLK